ncbi:MAG: hypothetical protein ABUS49_03560 [Acidobacteriota bacterium]
MTSELFLYSAYGLKLASEFFLPELPVSSGQPDVVIRRGSVPYTAHKGSKDEQFIFNTLSGSFRVTGGREIVVDPIAHADSKAVRVVLLGKVMACLVAQRGWLPLHASGVMIDGCAALFLGPSGTGKSTMAAALHARGHVVITDDVAPVRASGGACHVLPVWSRLRLAPESMHLVEGLPFEGTFQVDKYALDLGRPALPSLAPVRRVYVLDAGEDFRVESVRPPLAAALMSMNSFVKPRRSDREVLRLHMEQCAMVAEVVTLHHLVRPKNFSGLTALAQYIEKDMGSDHAVKK